MCCYLDWMRTLTHKWQMCDSKVIFWRLNKVFFLSRLNTFASLDGSRSFFCVVPAVVPCPQAWLWHGKHWFDSCALLVRFCESCNVQEWDESSWNRMWFEHSLKFDSCGANFLTVGDCLLRWWMSSAIYVRSSWFYKI